MVQAASWFPAHSSNKEGKNQPHGLPPVSYVFKMMADGSSAVKGSQVFAPSPAEVPSSSIVSPSLEAPTFISEKHLDPTATLPPLFVPSNVGPSPVVIATSLPSPDLNPTSTPGTVPIVTQPNNTNTANRKLSGPTRKLIAIAAVLTGLIALIFMVYILVDRRLFAACCSRKKVKSDQWTKFAPAAEPDTCENSEKRVVWLPSSARSLLSHGHRIPKSGSYSEVPCAPKISSESQIIDISASYPRSKFSVCSSEYPTSIEPSTRSANSVIISPCGHHTTDSPLLPAYEFCCLPSNHNSLEDNRHSRAHSASVFGHALNTDRLDVTIRPGEHRRSRSLSGLTYMVKSNERRESGSSASDWKGSPPSCLDGWSSAL